MKETELVESEKENNNSALTVIIVYSLIQYALVDWKLHSLIDWSWWFVVIPSLTMGALISWALLSAVIDSLRLRKAAREQAFKDTQDA